MVYVWVIPNEQWIYKPWKSQFLMAPQIQWNRQMLLKL